MKRKLFLSVLFLISIRLSSQIVFDCDPVRIQKLDSVVNFAKEVASENYFPVDVFLYHYDDAGRTSLVERLSLPSRTRVNRQNYFFDESGQKTHYILQVWTGTDYTDNSRTDYFYNDQDYLEREVFSGIVEGSWIPYQQHWYNYDENSVVTTYLRQMMYSEGVWTDFSYKNYIYDSRGRLIERNEQRIADGVIFWVELFTYDNMGRTSTRTRQSLKYFPATRTYAMTNLNRQIYSYDIYGELSEYAAETWTNDSWLLTGKSIYYRTLLPGIKVLICYKGNTIVLPVKNVAKFLEKGGVLGACECLENFQSAADLKSSGTIPFGVENTTQIVVYPNPASSGITVWVPGSAEKYSDLNIYNQSGSLVLKSRITDQSVTLDISQLKPGLYYLSASGQARSFKTTFVKKD